MADALHYIPGQEPVGTDDRAGSARLAAALDVPVAGYDVVAAAMIDRLVHYADVVSLKGDSYRLKDRDLGRVPAAATEES